jgi:hypothetical protein
VDGWDVKKGIVLLFNNLLFFNYPARSFWETSQVSSSIFKPARLKKTL